MKRTAIITAFIALFASLSFANGFKEGNKLYLGGKYQDALGQYQSFIQKNPDYYEGYFNAGNALYRQEQYDGALGMYKKAQELNPKDPDVQYNIDVTQKKMQEKKDQKQDRQKGNKDQQDKNGQQGQQKQQQGSNNKSNEGQKGQEQQAKQQQGKQGQKGNSGSETQNSESKQPPSGMTEDEVQALLNQKQNQEKRLQGYFGKQYPKQNNEQDMLNMSPQEIMQYMMQRQMDPNAEPQQKGGNGNEKDW